jgi:electron transfer flavoprotein beta subunit
MSNRFCSDNKVQVTREVDGGLQVISMPLPAVLSADLRLNTPRYATLPNIMKARKKPLDTLTLADLGIPTAKGNLITVQVNDPPTRKAGQKVDSVPTLVQKLKNEAKVV